MAKMENLIEMTKEEEGRYITMAANLSVIYADILSGKVFDFVGEMRKTAVREEKKAVNMLAEKRKLLEAFISKCVEERDYFADVASRLEDETEREYSMLSYAMANAVGKVHGINTSLVAKALTLYALCLNIDASIKAVGKRIAKFRYHRAKKIALNMQPITAALERVLNLLTKKSDRKIDLDNDEVVMRAIKVLSLRMADTELLNSIFTECEIDV